MAKIKAGDNEYIVVGESDGTIRIEMNGRAWFGLVGWVGADHAMFTSSIERVYDYATQDKLVDLTTVRRQYLDSVTKEV